MEYVINNGVLEYVIPKADDEEIIIPDGVKGVGDGFRYKSFPYDNRNDFKNISRISIPASFVDLIEADINYFTDLENLKEFVVDSRNPVYESIDGVLYKKQNEGKSLICYPRGRACDNYVIPDGVTHIRKNAFESVFDGPHSIVFPSSMKSVDLRFSGTYNAVYSITVFENLFCDFSKDLDNYCGVATWLWNWYSKSNLLITVLSLDGNVLYKIPIFINNASGKAQAEISLACNPINNAKLTVIDDLFDELKNKDEKLLTAAVRIGWPHMLSRDAKIKYEKYVSRYIKDAVSAAINLGYPDLIEVFVKNKLIKKTAFPEILDAVKAKKYDKQKEMLIEYYKEMLIEYYNGL